ncbi:phosphatidate cytidylyltransferase [Aeromonas cavernicola]|uniref:Phosphatidate cytidylyltransferase n=1 Tax=Aeromonas cavernicola TaxID=1006623 RepID=A0A2H9U7E5_9GAMM|nr:phosphatidate cytidylyltransferase [Aeromonas cavernicola]PJG59934.1 hypothetical protein CUC53_04730 [Aeromonas cavernicola]
MSIPIELLDLHHIDRPIFVVMALLYLMLGSVTLVVAKRFNGDRHIQLRAQVYSWWRIFPVVSAALLFYPMGIVGLALLICTLAAIELAQYTPYLSHGFIFKALLMIVINLTFYYFGMLGNIAILCLVGLILTLLFIFIKNRHKTTLLWGVFSLTLLLFLVLVGLINMPLATKNNADWLLYLFAVTALNDIGQFIFGKTLGRKKIVPNISPNKTWIGLFGGICLSMIVSLSLGLYLNLADWQVLVILSLLLALAGFFGDISFSAAKRAMGIKDFSNLIPGHGGILDRVDSLTMTAPILYLLLLIIY